jgi:PIN domain nuclease of toxin-antitoxin system
MGKKKAILILKGSTKSHWIKYITSLHMNVNPADRLGMSTSLGIMRTLASVDSKFLQPGFAY